MKSRTALTCEKILRNLVEEYSPFAIVGLPLVKKAVILIAGGDKRTVDRYCEQLVLLDYLKLESKRDMTFSLNWKKVLDGAQLRLHESLAVSSDEPP